MIVLIAKYTCKPGTGNDVLETLKKMAPLVKQEEPGCKMYHAAQSRDNPDYILLVEHYVDQDAVENHRNTPHYQEHIAGTIGPMLEKKEVEFYDLIIE